MVNNKYLLKNNKYLLFYKNIVVHLQREIIKMKSIKQMKSKRIIILSSLAIIAYCFMVVVTFMHEWNDMQLGFSRGFQDAQEEYNKDYVSLETLYFNLQPKASATVFPDTLTNIKNGKDYPAMISDVRIEFPQSEITFKSMFYKGGMIVLTIFIVICYISIPIRFISIMSRISNGNIFSAENVKSLNWLGIFLLSVFFLLFLFDFLGYLSAKSLFSFSSYAIKMSLPDFLWAILGLSALLIAEVLKRAIEIKEEQELTI